VIELDAERGAADPAGVEFPLAATPVAFPDGPPHVSGDAVGSGRRRLAPGLVRERLPLGVALEEQVEPGLEDLLRAGSGVRVGQGGAGGLELLQELPGDGDVETARIRGHRLDRLGMVPRWLRTEGRPQRRRSIPAFRPGVLVGWMNRDLTEIR
jgi:hypothetical protein